MRRSLALTATLAALCFAGLTGTASAWEYCDDGVNVCPSAQHCTGTVSVCPMAHPDNCHSNVDVCLDFVGP